MCLLDADEALCTPNTGRMACQEETEQQKWDRVLQEIGLSMDQGSSPSWITYGWQYRDADKPFDYSLDLKRPDINEQRNEGNAQKLLALMESGLSLRAAAKQLGIAPSNASITLKRFRERQANHAPTD